MNRTNPDPLQQVLAELDQLLDREHAALRKLDHGSLDNITQEKGELASRLKAAERTLQNAELAPVLQRIRRKAFENQLLLVHARDLVRGVLDLSRGPQSGSGALLEVRG